VLIACLATFAVVSTVGFYYLAESETSRLRQNYYEDSGHIAQIVRDQFFEVYRDLEDANLFISQLANELVRLEDVVHIEVYDRFKRLSAKSYMDRSGRPDDYPLHGGFVEKVMETGKTLTMEHYPEKLFEVVAPLFLAGDEHGGAPIGAVIVGIRTAGRDREIETKAMMLTDIIQLAVGKSATHLEIERIYIDSITRRLGKIKGLASLSVYDNSLKVMAHSESGHVGEDAGETATNLREVLKTGVELEMEDVEGKAIHKYIPVVLRDEEGSDYTAAVVDIAVDTGYIDDTVRDMRRMMFNVALAITLTTLLAIWVVLRAVVVRPIKRFSDITESVAAGDLDSRVDIDSDDEFGMLGESFNRMTEELRQSRDELLSARNFNQDVLASLYESLVVVSNEGHVVMANEAAGELLGYSMDEMKTLHIGAFLPGWDEVLGESRSRGLAVFSERLFNRKDGISVPVSLSASEVSSQSLGVIFGFVIVATDIRERKKTEEAMREYTRKLEAYTAELVEADQRMRESEERFRLAFETGPDPIMLTRLRDGKYVDVNNGFVSMTDFPKESVIGRSAYDEVSLWMDMQERDNFLMGLEKEGWIRNRPMKITLRDGSVRECLVSASVFDLGGEPHLLTLIRDISELRGAQRDRDQLTEQLIEKNRELEQLVYVSSHDLRSPLVNVHGFSREIEMDFDDLVTLLDDIPIPEDKRETVTRIIHNDIPGSLAYIKSSIDKMDSHLKGLLKLSRLGRTEVEIEELDMDRLTDEVIDNFSFRIKEENIRVDRTLLPKCLGDEGLVSQAVSNIVDNALKYMDGSRRGVITISGWREDEMSVYCIRDNGKGIRREYQEKVFEIFHRLEPKAVSGEGLGLSIVQKAISRSGGKVWLESEEGKGSRLYLSLPSA